MKNTGPVSLRQFEEADFETLTSWFADEPSLIQWGGPATRYPLDRPQLAAMRAEGEGARPLRWLISGEIGTHLATHAQVALDWHHGVARLSRVAIAPSFRGQGLGRSFLQTIIDRIFALPNFERVELNVYTFNHVAIRLYRSLGFVEEGVRRRAVRAGSARWDTAIYGLLRDEAVRQPR